MIGQTAAVLLICPMRVVYHHRSDSTINIIYTTQTMPTVREIFLLDIQAIATDNGAKVSSDSLGMAAMEIFQARFD